MKLFAFLLAFLFSTAAFAVLPSGVVGSPYSFTLTALGGQPPYTFSTTSGTLPAGLSLNASTGVISGTPTTAVASDPLTFTVTDSLGTAMPKATFLTISGGSSGPCPVTVGPITVNVTSPRSAAIAPFLAFFDATATTYSSTLKGANNPFQDLTYTWNFGDSGASGTGTWLYGSHPNTNSRNASTGPVAAHLYILPDGSGDTNYATTVTVTDGTNTASCTYGVTTYDPSGSNGFSGTKTTCVSSSGTPIAGSGGCPIGAAVANTASFNTALASIGSNHRTLFKCGDTFTGDNVVFSGVTWSVGAYGSCIGIQTGRPVFSDSVNGNQIFGFSSGAGDGRISDIDMEGGGSGARGVWDTLFNVGGTIRIIYQITINNLISNGISTSYGFAQGAQWGVINSVAGPGATNIPLFFNFNENNYPYTGNTINNLFYSASIGNSITGVGGTGGSGVETFRISACNGCVFTNSSYFNANNIGALIKLHNGNTNNSSPTWTGTYTQNVVLSDNYAAGSSGAQLIENAPQNGADDERLRNIIFERNLLAGCTSQGGRQLLVSAVNESVRDNVFNISCTSALYPSVGVVADARGVEPTPTGIEIYNNTCYQATNTGSTQNCVLIAANGCCTGAPAINSFAQNNMFYSVTGQATVINTPASNTVSNNTTTTTANPTFTNGSGNFSLISDFKPTANFSGGTSVPVFFDALGVQWLPTWDLGSVHH